MTPKEALVKDGFPVKEGRGRLSREADARCRELASSGWNIKGYVVSKAPATVDMPKHTAITKVKATNVKEIAELPAMRYDERDGWYAVSDSPNWCGMTKFGIREVCENCGNSLSYHFCNSPFVLGVPVRIVQ